MVLNENRGVGSGVCASRLARAVAISAASALMAHLAIPSDAVAQLRPPLSLIPTATIGVAGGGGAAEFGAIEAVATYEDREVFYVVDRLNARLSAFTRDGKFIASAGRSGSGPGEFRAATEAASEGSTVYVLDPILSRISIFQLRGSALLPVADRRLGFAAKALCVMDGQVFLLGYNNGRMVHQFDPATGKLSASFGAPFRAGDAVIGSMTDAGYIVCDSESGSLYVAAVATAVLRRYSAQGRLIWQAAIPQMAPSVITRTRTGVRFSAPAGRTFDDSVTSLALVPGGRILVQFGAGFSGIQSLQDIVDVRSVVFDRRTGSRFDGGSALPRIDFASGGHAYSHAHEPFPRIIVYAWR